MAKIPDGWGWVAKPYKKSIGWAEDPKPPPPPPYSTPMQILKDKANRITCSNGLISADHSAPRSLRKDPGTGLSRGTVKFLVAACAQMRR